VAEAVSAGAVSMLWTIESTASGRQLPIVVTDGKWAEASALVPVLVPVLVFRVHRRVDAAGSTVFVLTVSREVCV